MSNLADRLGTPTPGPSLTPNRGITPGLPTNHGSFKAAERPDPGLALNHPVRPVALPPGTAAHALLSRLDSEGKTVIDYLRDDHGSVPHIAEGFAKTLAAITDDQALAAAYPGRSWTYLDSVSGAPYFDHADAALVASVLTQHYRRVPASPTFGFDVTYTPDGEPAEYIISATLDSGVTLTRRGSVDNLRPSDTRDGLWAATEYAASMRSEFDAILDQARRLDLVAPERPATPDRSSIPGARSDLRWIERSDLTALLPVGRKFRQANIIEGGFIEEPHPSDYVTITGHQQYAVAVQYPGGSSGGPMISRDDQFAADSSGTVWILDKNQRPFLAYIPA